MTREEIIALAQQAGFVVDEEAYAHQPNCIFHTWHLIDEGLARFANLVAAVEREECAKLCDGWTHADGDQCAAAIRARGEQ